QAVRPSHDVIGAIQSPAAPGLHDGLDIGSIHAHSRDLAAFLLAKNDLPAGGERLPIGRSRLLANDFHRAIRQTPVRALGLDILEQERSVRAPKWTFSELKSVGHKEKALALDQARK